jgi:HK97 family phage major capsid protein
LLAVFGDLSLGCYFGDRRSVTFKMLNELYAENDQVGVQATERIALDVVNPEVLAKITLT